jgi:hypothetical protein
MALVPQRNTNIVNVYSVTLPEGDRLQFQGRGNGEGDWGRRGRGIGPISYLQRTPLIPELLSKRELLNPQRLQGSQVRIEITLRVFGRRQEVHDFEEKRIGAIRVPIRL